MDQSFARAEYDLDHTIDKDANKENEANDIIKLVNSLPQKAKDQGLPTFRTLSIEGEDIEFSKGFTDLHTVSYQKILKGEGYGLTDAKSSIEIVSEIRNKK